MDDARTVADALGVLLQRRFRAGLQAETVADVHPAVDAATYPVLSGLARLPAGASVSVAALGAEVGLDRSVVSRRAGILVEAGLLRTSIDPADRRATVLVLTPAGRAVVRRLRTRLTHAIERRLADWPATDRRRFAVLLARFVEELDEAGPTAGAGHDRAP